MHIETQFDNYFYNEEIRCEYTVTSKLKKVWAVEIDLVNKILEICEKHEIRVYAFAGTMLGAVRHKGFIPWDDDLDVCLLREDYEKFLKIAPQELNEPYFLQTPLSDTKFFCGYSRLRNSSTTGIIRWDNSPDYNSGIYVDIYVLDGYIENKWKYYLQLVQKGILVRLLLAYSSSNKSNRMIHIIGSFERKFIPYEKLVRAYEKILMKFNKKTNRVSIMTHYKGFIEKYWCYKENLQNMTMMPFENIKIPIAGNYHQMLTNMYGNYMEYPPMQERGEWHNNNIIFEPDTPYKKYFEDHSIKQKI